MFKTIKEKLSWKSLEESISLITQRFPLSVIALVVSFILSSVLLHGDFFMNDYQLVVMAKTTLTFLFVALLAYAIALAGESYTTENNVRRIWATIVVIMCGVLYYLYIPEVFDSAPTDVLFTMFGILFLVFVASFSARFINLFRTKKYSDTPFYLFVINQMLAMLEGFFVAFFLFLLGAATLGSIDVLFSLSIDGKLYAQWWIFAALIVGPLYFLAHVPTTVQEDKISLQTFGKFLRFIIVYVALPFIGIYFVILYTYSSKVLINFTQWPEGIVSWLVIMFSFFGFVTYFLSYHVREERVVSFFRRWFPYVLAPQVLMLFYAIGLRVAQHGITINRYFVIAFGVWIAFLCVYYIFSKTKTLFALPASLFVALIIVLIGPWGVFATSERSQLSRLNNLFVEHQVIQDKTIVPLTNETLKNISDTDQESMISIIRYVCSNHGCPALIPVLGSDYNEAVGEATDQYVQASGIIDHVGLPSYVTIVREEAVNKEKRIVSLFATSDGFVIDTVNTESLTLVMSYADFKTPFGVSATDRVIINYSKGDIQKSEDITDQVQKVALSLPTNGFFPENQPSPEKILFGDGTLYITGMSAEIQDSSVKKFMNIEGFIVVNQ